MRELAGFEIRSRHFEQSFYAVREWVEANFQFPRSLSLPELNVYHARDVVAGWEVSVEFSGGIRRLHLLLDKSFPRSVAQIALVDRPDYMHWPHVGSDGVLCILPGTAEVDAALPAAATSAIFGQACELVSELIAGKRQEDFRDEFLPYWTREAVRGVPFYSLCAPTDPSRQIAVWRGKQYYLLGDDEQQVLGWLNHFSGKEREDRTTEFGLLIWVNRPLIPAEYPRTGKMVRELAATCGCGDAFDHLLGDGSKTAVVLLGMKSANGPCFAGLTLVTSSESRGPHSQTINPVFKGFRPGKVPERLMSKRVLSSNRALLLEPRK